MTHDAIDHHSNRWFEILASILLINCVYQIDRISQLRHYMLSSTLRIDRTFFIFLQLLHLSQLKLC